MKTTEPAATQPSIEGRATEFAPVAGGGDTTSAEALLVTAYAAMWIVVFLFVWLTSRRQQTLDTRLGDVELALRRAEDGGEGASAK